MAGSRKRKSARNGPRPVDYGDLPREELTRRAAVAHLVGWDVRFKFTCSACRTRCAFADLNTLWTEGVCSACGRTTTVVRGGFMLEATRPTAAMMAWAASSGESRYGIL